MVGDRLPQVHDPVLEVAVLPERGDVGGVVGVPVLVLGAGQGVQVDDRVDAVPAERLDGPVEVTEPVALDLERPGVVLEMLVAHGDPGQVEPGLLEERRVRLAEELGEQAVEEPVRPVVADHLADLPPHQRLVGGVPGDEVLHVEPAAEAHPAQQQRLAVGAEELRPGGPDHGGRCGHLTPLSRKFRDIPERVSVHQPYGDVHGPVKRSPGRCGPR